MATAVITAKEYAYPKGRSMTDRTTKRRGTIAFNGGNYFTGGTILALPPVDSSNVVPVDVSLRSLKGLGYEYAWVNADLWPQDTAIVVGWAIQDPNGNLQVCTTSGTTNNSAEPTWAIPTTAAPNPTTTDGTAVWTCMGASIGLVKILTGAAAQSPLTELTSGGAIPAAVQADVIEYSADYLKG
jgi:hypothetical protein